MFSLLDILLKPLKWILANLMKIFFNINRYTLIPIIVKFLIDFFGHRLPLIYNILLRFVLGAVSILFSNLLELIVKENCTKDKNAFKILLKQVYTSFIQYAGAYLLPTGILLLLDFIGIGEMIQFSEEIPFIGHFVQLFLWIIGYSISTWLIKTLNFGDKCSDSISSFNHMVGVAAIIVVIGYEGFHAFF